VSATKIPNLRDLRKLEALHRRERVLEGGCIVGALAGLVLGGYLVATFSPFSNEVSRVSNMGWASAGVVFLALAGILVRKWFQAESQRKAAREAYRKEAAAYAIGSDYILLTEGENVAADNSR
jgi:hypothetical protein